MLTAVAFGPLLETLQPTLQAVGISLRPPYHLLQQSGPAGPDRKVNWLLFDDRALHPLLVLKLVRGRGREQQLEREAAILQDLWERPSLQGTIPQPLGFVSHSGRPILVESFLTGTPLTLLLTTPRQRRPGAAQRHLAQAGAWLQRLQAGTRQENTFAGREAVAKRLSRWPREALPQRFVADLLARAGDAAGLSLPLVNSHGDFWPGNTLLTEDGSIAVTDWEAYAAAGPAFHDLFFFLTTYVEQYPLRPWRRGSRLARFRRGLLADNWLAQLAVETMLAALRRYDLPPATLPLFYPLFLLHKATPTGTATEKERREAAAWQDRLAEYARVPPAMRQSAWSGDRS